MKTIIIKAIKKLATVLLTDKKFWKNVLLIVMMVVVIVIMPLAVVLGLCNGFISVDKDNFKNVFGGAISSSFENHMEAYKPIMTEIEDVFLERGMSDDQVKEAQMLFSFVLTDKVEEENFVSTLADCFENSSTDAELIQSINDTFGKSITEEDYNKVMDCLTTEQPAMPTEEVG